ncbi:hypothetical protein GAN17_23620 [Mycobacterium kubicae]|nr:hypothetical protein GAN17_23620 [Mycobacterium kubicae]
MQWNLLGVVMVYTGHGAARCAHAADDAATSGVSIPGLIAAGAWALGLVAGIVALVTGHTAVAAVALVGAVMAPWLGLALIGHRDHGASFSTRQPVEGSSADATSFAGGWPSLRFTTN